MKQTALTEPKPSRAFWDKYLAAIMAVAALLLCAVASAQTTDSLKYSQINGYGFKYKRMAFDSTLMIPLSNSPHSPYRMGALRYRASDSTLQLWTGYQWNSIVTGVGNGVDTAYLYDDSTLAIETPDADYFVKIVGRHWNLQGVLNNGSTLTENENITLADSLEFTSGWVIIDSLRLRSLPQKTDTTSNKPIAVDAFGNVVKMSGWPHPPAIDTANKWVNDIRRSNDSVYAFKNGSWQFKYKDSTGGGGTLAQNSVGDSLGTGSMSVRVQEIANDNNNPCYWCDVALSLPKSKLAHIRDTFALVSDSSHLNIFIGPGTHSYGDDYSRYQMNIVDLLLAKYPFAGPGLFSGNMNNYQFSPVSGWTLRTLLTTPKGRGLAGQSLLSTSTDITIASGTNWAQNSYNSYQDIIIMTYDTATGGTFSVEVDGVKIDTIDTSIGTGLTVNSYHLSQDMKHTIVLHEVTAGTTHCELLDMYLYTSNKRGIIVSKAACGSSAVTHWAAQPRTHAIQLLQAIPGGVDMIISDLGVNNQNQNIDTNTARIQQDTLIRRWRVASPNVGIVLMKGTQYSFQRYGTPTHSTKSYNRQLDQLARVDSVATFNNDRIVGDFPRSLDIRTITLDSLHPTSQSFYTIAAELLTNIGAFNTDIGLKEPNLLTGPDSSHVVNPVGSQRYTIWDIGTWKNKGLNHFIMQNSAGTQSLDIDVTSVNQVNHVSQGGASTAYSWDGSGVFASTITANGTSGLNTIKGRLYLGNSGGTENVFIKDALSKGYTDVTIDPSGTSGYAWFKLNDGGGSEQGRIITLGSSAGIGSSGTAFENSAFALTAQSGTMNIGTTANNTFRIFTGGSAATNVRMSVSGAGAITMNNGSNSYAFPSARASAGQVLTDVSGNGTLTWETPSGGISGSGTSGRIAYWNGSSSLTSNANFLFNGSVFSTGTTNTQGQLNVGGSKDLTSSGAQSYFAAATYTDQVTAASGTASSYSINYIAPPTIAAANSSVTFPNITNLMVDAPVAGTNATITNKYAIQTGSNGHVRVQGKLYLTDRDSSATPANVAWIDPLTEQLKVGPYQRTLKGTANWTPGVVAAGSSATTTVTVTGAALGDPVTISKASGAYSNGEVYDAFVSATNTVTIRVHNVSTGSANYSSAADYNVVVLKY